MTSSDIREPAEVINEDAHVKLKRQRFLFCRLRLRRLPGNTSTVAIRTTASTSPQHRHHRDLRRHLSQKLCGHRPRFLWRKPKLRQLPDPKSTPLSFIAGAGANATPASSPIPLISTRSKIVGLYSLGMLQDVSRTFHVVYTSTKSDHESSGTPTTNSSAKRESSAPSQINGVGNTVAAIAAEHMHTDGGISYA